MDNLVCLNILSDHLTIFKLFRLWDKTFIIGNGEHWIVNLFLIPSTKVFSNVTKSTFLPFPTKLWESQIWNIEDFSSRILINIRWNF